MIQRSQTIYLFLVALCAGLTLAFSFSTYEIMDTMNPVNFDSFGFEPTGKNLSTFPLFIILLPITLIAIFSIFLFKKRKLQLNINKLNYLLILLVIVLIFIDFGSFDDSYKLNSYGVGMFLPLAALVFNFLANRGIKNDNKLIDSLDRLR